MDKSHKKAEEVGGGEYLTQMRMAIEHVREARKFASRKGRANSLILRIERHIAECEEDAAKKDAKVMKWDGTPGAVE